MDHMHRTRADEATLITSASVSYDDEYAKRRKKYAIMMGTRALCVVAAALTYRFSVWLALAFIVGGMALPWCAVIIANDGPAKKRSRVPAPTARSDERGLPPGAGGQSTDGRTVDG